MKATLVRRFTKIEVVYHAIQLILYLILFVSGGALLLQRIFETEKIDFTTLSNIHRLTGIVLIAFILQTILISIFATSFTPLWKTLLDAFKWKPKDLVWLVNIGLHTFVPKVTIPPSDRFNPGQKLHLLVIFLVLIGFSSTGLVIILIPGAIGVWIAHVVCFVPALLFLGLHLFLSLVNPPTSKALKGMITGYVPLDYAREHHSLWQNGEDPDIHANHVSLSAIILTTFGVVAVLFSGVWYIGFGQVKSQVVKVAGNNGREVILPGKLVSGHAEEPKAKHCTACHNFLNSPPSDKCLKCHEEIQTVMDNRQGYHGNLNGKCRTCHSEHKGLAANIFSLDPKAFNHENSRYSLLGKHQDLDCVKCHSVPDKKTKQVKTKYIGLEFETCIQCHENPHPNIKDKNDCLSCHTMRGWSKDKLVFDHNQDSQYKLEGKHIEVSCKKCHPSSSKEKGATMVKLINIGSECGDCHDDIHKRQFKKKCKSCHMEDGWKAPWLAEFHGADSAYPLRGAHGKVKCSDCHKLPDKDAKLANAKFSGLSHECSSCHDDPHEGQFKKKCQSCHLEDSWKGPWLVEFHGVNSSYPLKGAHNKVKCVDCHKLPGKDAKLANAKFSGLSHKCSSCHDDPHKGQITHSCEICHQAQGWKERDLLFVHNQHSSYKLDNLHAVISCSLCHLPDEAKVIQYRPLPLKCDQCHTDIVDFINGKSTIGNAAADPHAGRVTCIDCHSVDLAKQQQYQYARKCVSCHNLRYYDLYFDWEKSIGQGIEIALKIINPLNNNHNSEKEILANKIKIIRKIGFHNIQMSKKLIEGIR